MRAAFLKGIQNFEIKDVPVPEIKTEEVLIRVKSVGICGSDVHYFTNGRIGPTKAVFPYIIGHECCGVIEKVGIGVKKIGPGAKVTVEPAIYCYNCNYCREGKYNICPNVGFLGTPPVPGAYSEYIALPERNVIEIPHEFSYDDGALLEPLTIGFHALNLSELKDGQNVAVYGCGTIGLLILSVIREKTKGKIFAFDRLDYRLEAARRLGADYVVNTDMVDPVKLIREKTMYGVERCFEAAGSAEAMYYSAEITAPGGIVVLGGIPEDDDISFNAHTSRRKELNLKFLRRSNCEIDEAIEFMKTKKGIISSIITHKFSLDEIAEAFGLMSEYADGIIKAVINL